MSETLTLPPHPGVVQRKCQIEEVFEPGFIELLKLVPSNPYIRALVLKFTGKMPPLECQTFEHLKDWVEFNCVRRIRPKIRSSKNTGQGGISINVDFSEMEYGRCDYSAERSGSEAFSIGPDDLVDMIQEAIADGHGLTELVETIAEQIDDDAWDQCDPDLYNYGDYDYSDHESGSSDSRKMEYSRNDIRNAVLQFVQQHHPELAAEL